MNSAHVWVPLCVEAFGFHVSICFMCKSPTRLWCAAAWGGVRSVDEALAILEKHGKKKDKDKHKSKSKSKEKTHKKQKEKHSKDKKKKKHT